MRWLINFTTKDNIFSKNKKNDVINNLKKYLNNDVNYKILLVFIRIENYKLKVKRAI